MPGDMAAANLGYHPVGSGAKRHLSAPMPTVECLALVATLCGLPGPGVAGLIHQYERAAERLATHAASLAVGALHRSLHGHRRAFLVGDVVVGTLDDPRALAVGARADREQFDRLQ